MREHATEKEKRWRNRYEFILDRISERDTGISVGELIAECGVRMTPANLQSLLLRLQFTLPTNPGEKRRLKRDNSRPIKWTIITKA